MWNYSFVTYGMRSKLQYLGLFWPELKTQGIIEKISMELIDIKGNKVNISFGRLNQS